MKNEAAHTPGPWKVTSYGDGQYSIKNNNDVGYEEGNIPELEDLANASLIASAPDLLKERDELKEHLFKSQVFISNQGLVNAELLEALKEAIAKAEGKEASNG